MGSFTGLRLNLEKTIAFDPNAIGKLEVANITVRCAPVKYLGAYLGLGDLTKINFETPLRKAKAVISQWQRRSLTLDMRILVIKTFVFSVFVHVLNTVFISQYQIDLIQKLINGFLWRGWNKVQQSVMISSYDQGGLKILHVKNVIHEL